MLFIPIVFFRLYETVLSINITKKTQKKTMLSKYVFSFVVSFYFAYYDLN